MLQLNSHNSPDSLFEVPNPFRKPLHWPSSHSLAPRVVHLRHLRLAATMLSCCLVKTLYSEALAVWIMTFLSVLDSVLRSLMSSTSLALNAQMTSEGPSKSSRANPRASADAFCCAVQLAPLRQPMATSHSGFLPRELEATARHHGTSGDRTGGPAGCVASCGFQSVSAHGFPPNSPGLLEMLIVQVLRQRRRIPRRVLRRR